MLSPAKYQERLHNLSAIAQKVYAAVPASEPWSMTCIHQEIQRTGGSTRDARIVHGCLNTLKESGLIEEPTRGTFIRSAIRPEKPKTTEITTKEEKMPAAPTPKQPRNPMTILSELAVRCKSLADEIETAALEIDDYVKSKDADAGKLRQLQELLKGLS